MNRILFSLLVIILWSACLQAAPNTPAIPATPVILVLGDSLSAGYGIGKEQSWPSLLARRLQEKRLPQRVVNISISGETTAGGRSRLAAALKEHRPQIVLLELGANDGLRGLPLEQMQDNLAAMIQL
ncbi:MAG: arylesterase, partial [Sterolibacterium sp.]|nr:arylesterase [Sterolibacterium sp.]